MWQNKLKELNINIHLIATGGGAGLQQILWSTPGSSSYLSGASFPYGKEEQEDLLGFMPEHFCSEEAAIDLASAAYMKAYRFGGPKPVGIGIAASVASEKIHRGDHRIFACIITNDKINTCHLLLEKGVGKQRRLLDGQICDDMGLFLLSETLQLEEAVLPNELVIQTAQDKAKDRFFLRPFFQANGKRMETMPKRKFALMPGAYNPPHEGHFSVVDQVMNQYSYDTVFEITAEPPHKEALSVQALLQRAKLLQGYNRLFTRKCPLYLDKAKAFPNTPIILGADAMLRMLDPKWGLNPLQMFGEFNKLGTKFLVNGRLVDNTFVTPMDIINKLYFQLYQDANNLILPVEGRLDLSSTEIRDKNKC